MDSRLRFLHYDMTELWGRMWRAGARNGKPRASEEVCGRQIRRISQSRDADRNKVGKPVSHVPRKAAIVHIIPVP